eukprot:PhM_4_TR18829/c0_g1_i1/m.95934
MRILDKYGTCSMYFFVCSQEKKTSSEMNSGFPTSRTEHCRMAYRLGYHPAAIRALMLLVFNSGDTSRPRESDYHLSLFSTEDVLLFCVDRTEVLVVNITDGDPRSTACTRTFLLVDDDDSKDVARIREWNKTSLPHHCIFSSMCYDRALDWCTHNHCMIELSEEGVSFDMRDTSYPDDERVLLGDDHVVVLGAWGRDECAADLLGLV